MHDYATWMREWNGGKNPPRHIEIQNQVQCKVGDGTTSYEWGVIGAWCGGEMFYFERKPIRDLWQAMRCGSGEILRRREEFAARPDPFGVPVEVPLLQQAFPLVTGKVLDLSKPPEADLSKGEPFAEVSEEWKRAMALAEQARMMEWHRVEGLGHDKALKAIKAEMLALAKDCEEIWLPNGIKLKIASVSRAGYSVKPTTYKTTKAFIPGNLEDDGAL